MEKEYKVFEKLINKLKKIPFDKWQWRRNKLGTEVRYEVDFENGECRGVIINYRDILDRLPIQEFGVYDNNKLLYSFKFKNKDPLATELFEQLEEGYREYKSKKDEEERERNKKEIQKIKNKEHRKLRKLEQILG